MTIHLHWSQSAKLLKEVTTGIALCGLRNIPRKQMSAFIEDADCPECLKRAAQPKPRERPKLTKEAVRRLK